MPPIEFIVHRKEAGQTLASVLKKRFGISWKHAKSLVEKKHVRVGQQYETDVARRLKVGKKVYLDTGTIHAPPGAGAKPKSSVSSKAEPAPDQPSKAKPVTGTRPQPPQASTRRKPSAAEAGIEIVYADDAIVVVNKPAGLTTMRHREEREEFGEHGQKFLPTTLAEMLPSILGTPNRRVIPVHRIDRDTSGLVVFACNRVAADDLTHQFRKHTIDRRYLALCRGIPKPGRVESGLIRDRGDGRRGSSRDLIAEDVRRAVTHIKLLEELGGFALVECRLETGRTHQIRIHLGEAGTPLCGERVYDRPLSGSLSRDTSGAEYPMLHAARLGLLHPDNHQPIAWDVKTPNDFSRLWALLREQSGRATSH